MSRNDEKFKSADTLAKAPKRRRNIVDPLNKPVALD